MPNKYPFGVQYLSESWLEAADKALGGMTVGTTERLAVGYEVTGTPRGKVRYALIAESGTVSVSPGAASEPDATMTLDYDTAAEITRGEISPQAAFMQGRLKLGGDVLVLINRARELASIGDALAGLRSETEF